ncbi:MAG TPA: hypothetical protein VNG29_00970 [Candidatus Paceibacterota bacterium]|nr:hypothetical protein [Candidatus Paceibacterota bacterium]
MKANRFGKKKAVAGLSQTRLLTLGLGALNRLLVKKGIIGKKELQRAVLKEIKKRGKRAK